MAKRLSKAQWAKVKVDREYKGLSFHDLANKYGVSSATIHRRAKFEMWSNNFVDDQTKRNETANETDGSADHIDLKRDPETIKQNFHPSRMKDKNYMQYQLGEISKHLSDLSSVFEPIGRGKYRLEFANIAYNIALLGGTSDRLAETLGVNETTIYNWLKAYPEFRIAWVAGKDLADAEVVRALHKKAVGYQMTIEDFKVYKGDVNAQRFWLINRQPDAWKDKVNVRT